MPTATYIPLANLTLSSTASSVSITGISQIYRDLVLIAVPISATNGGMQTRVNNDTTSNYDYVLAETDGSSSPTSNSGNTTSFLTTWNYNEIANVPSPVIFNYIGYTSTSQHKAILARVNKAGGSGAVSMAACKYGSSSAITSIQIIGSFVAGSSFALYGIAA